MAISHVRSAQALVNSCIPLPKISSPSPRFRCFLFSARSSLTIRAAAVSPALPVLPTPVCTPSSRLEKVYQGRFVIRSSDVTYTNHASIEAIVSLLREVSLDHMITSGLDTKGFGTLLSMREHRLIWVLTKMHIELHDKLTWRDEVEIETWFQMKGKLGIEGNWLIRNVATRKVVGKATSIWVMINEATRKLSKIQEDVLDELGLYMVDPPRRLFKDAEKPIQKASSAQQSDCYVKTSLRPRRNDIDMNHHVSNMTYISWMLESVPEDYLKTHDLTSIEIEYKRECGFEDELVSMSCCLKEEDPDCGQTSKEFVHRLQLSGTGKDVCVGRTTYIRVT